MSEDNPKNFYRGRLAPTPSGYLHVGHARTFCTAWKRARKLDGTLILRMDDLDPSRCREEFADACKEDIRKMGITWDEGPDVEQSTHGPYLQSQCSDLYYEALVRLWRKGFAYACKKTRKEIRGAGLLNPTKDEFLFPQEFRSSQVEDLSQTPSKKVNWRFRTNWGDKISFPDKRKGNVQFEVGRDFSDFLIWRKDGFSSYELATVVDDQRMKVSEVVRGEDLLVSSARQCLIFDALGWPRPEFYHCELVLDDKGRKLSKSTRSIARSFATS